MSICQTGRPVASRSALRALKRTAVLACAHGASVQRTAVLACAQCASRTEAPSNGLRKYHRRERHDGTTHSHVDFLNLIIYVFGDHSSFILTTWPPRSLLFFHQSNPSSYFFSNIFHCPSPHSLYNGYSSNPILAYISPASLLF